MAAHLWLAILLTLLSSAAPWCLKTTVNLTAAVSKVDYSPNGAYIAVTVKDTAVYIYETINFLKVFTYTNSDNIRTARFTKNGTFLGVGFDNGKVRLIPGTPPFSLTATYTVSTQAQSIIDIDFN